MNDAQVEEQAVRLLHDPKWREVKRQRSSLRLCQLSTNRIPLHSISVEQIEQLDDQSVQSTYEGVMRERAKRLKAANGQTKYENPEAQLLGLRNDFERNR